MSAPGLPATGRAAAENELLAELGLPPSASPEDVDRVHAAVSDYLASAPSAVRGWAHAQSAALDAAYLHLTDPVGFGGSALRSPTRPPRVEPGGPATPPARRDPLPEVAPDVDDDTSDSDGFEALYASVTPSAHSDMGPDRKRAARNLELQGSAALAAPAADGGIWKKLFLGGVAIAAAAAMLVIGINLGGGGAPGDAPGSSAVAQASAPAIDEAKVADLMAKLQANPNDTATLLALANEFYAGEAYDTAATWLDKVLALEPENIDALLARGAVSFNLGDLASAETTWNKVVAIDPKNVEVHYDLGFMYLNLATPDLAGVQREWNTVIELDPSSQLAQTVRSHLDSLAASSMLPAASGAASPGPTGSAAASPDVSVVASPASSASASTQP